MTGAACAFIAIVIPLLTPFFIWAARRRLAESPRLIVREDFLWDTNGDLLSDHGRFKVAERLLEVRERGRVRSIAFAQIAGLSIRVGTSRKVYQGVILKETEEIAHLGIITGHDLKGAGINAHMLCVALGGEVLGEAFLQAFREHLWSPTLLGDEFRFFFED